MKLQNKETGQVENFCIDKDQICSCNRAFVYDSLAQLQEAGWEDYEKPKDRWFMDCCGDVYKVYFDGGCVDTQRKQIGNYFETKEEAEKAVEKLKAWKRLTDKGFRFTGCVFDNYIRFELPYMEWDKNISDDLDLLFGGEE